MVSGTLILNFMAGGRADFVLRASWWWWWWWWWRRRSWEVAESGAFGHGVPADFSDDDS